MSVTMWLALVLQFASVALLRLFLGHTWLRRPGTLLMLASVVYDGLSQILLSFPSVAQWDTFRNGIAPGFIDEADLMMSAGMLAFTVAYLRTCGPRREAPAEPGDAALAARVLDWRILALACLPLAVLTYRSRALGGALATGTSAPLSASVPAAFFDLLIVLAAAGFVLRHGGRWFVPVLAAQSLLLAAAGERGPVVVDAVTLVVLLARAGMRPSGRQVGVAVMLAAAAFTAVAGVRAQQGRAALSDAAGLGARVTVLAGGLGDAAPAGAGGPGIAAQYASRLDGAAFAGAIVQAESMGDARLGAANVPESMLIAVPSAMWPSKLTHGLALNPGQAETDEFGLQQTNFLTGPAALYAGFLTPLWLVVLLAVLGAVWGRGEQWLLRSATPARMVILAGAVSAALRYEQGVPSMLVAIREAAVIAVIALLATSAGRRLIAACRAVPSGFKGGNPGMLPS
jgi:hypothetical protein